MIEHYSFQFGTVFLFASKSILISSYMADNASKREFRRAEVGGAEMFLLESILALLKFNFIFTPTLMKISTRYTARHTTTTATFDPPLLYPTLGLPRLLQAFPICDDKVFVPVTVDFLKTVRS